MEEVVAESGRIDALVNNAAICFYADILHDSLEYWRQMQQVNLEAVYWGCKLVAPYMAEQKRGWIINISSIQALMTEGNAGSYCAAKGAILSFTRSLAVELAPYGVLANAIAPGCIHTPMSVVNGVDETTTSFFQEWYIGKRKIPLARPGEPEGNRESGSFSRIRRLLVHDRKHSGRGWRDEFDFLTTHSDKVWIRVYIKPTRNRHHDRSQGAGMVCQNVF